MTKFMGGDWDGEPRTVGFFLEDKPVDLCEVTARINEEGLNLQGNCKEAFTHNRVCKHVDYVAGYFRIHGEIPVSIDKTVPPDVVHEARADGEAFRELMMTRGRVIVL